MATPVSPPPMYRPPVIKPVPLVAAVLISVVLSTAWTTLFTYLQRRFGLSAYATRKLVHITTAPLYLLMLPLYPTGHPLAGAWAAVAPLLAALRLGLGTDRLFPAVGARSPGAAYGAAVGLALLLEGPRPCGALGVSVCMLSFGDAAAALAGRRWGTKTARKTLPGSLAFFIVSWAGTAAWLALLRALAGGPPVGLRPLGAVAAICALVEAATTGEDNLTVPAAALTMCWLLAI